MTTEAILLGGEGNLAKRIISRYPNFLSYSRSQCDITDGQAVELLISEIKPTYVINCAAITDVEYCEKNPKHCWEVNTYGVRNIVESCIKNNVKLIHFSSDYANNPVNEYGWSKFASESIALKAGTVFRTNFFDENNFIVKNLLLGKNINVYQDVYFNPISVFGLIDNLFSGDNYSDNKLLNIGTIDAITMYDFASNFCEVFDLDKSLITRANYIPSGLAVRSKNLYIHPDNNLSIVNDLRRFKNELKK